MLDNIKLLAPAKLNIFLKIVGRRSDGYHLIRSGITFLNLYDEITLRKSNKLNISYSGDFKPENNTYEDCIIKKTIHFLNLKDEIKLDISINKNIPVQGGLGSASTNAATFIHALFLLGYIKKKEPKDYAFLGADIPCFIYNKNCLISGIGDKISPVKFPKYYFLLVKPNFNHSTKKMYKTLGFAKNSYIENYTYLENNIMDDDTGNDFEYLILKKNKNFREIFEFLENNKKNIFTRMTGSGSCVFGVFENNKDALEAKKNFDDNFPNLWSKVVENNLE